jgi:hypothetical protein
MRGKATFAHLEGLTQSVSAILMLELFHHREARGGISADKMPKAFFTRYELDRERRSAIEAKGK